MVKVCLENKTNNKVKYYKPSWLGHTSLQFLGTTAWYEVSPVCSCLHV